MASKAAPRLAIIGCGAIVEFAWILALRRIGWHPSVLIDSSSRQLDVIERKAGRQGSVVKSSNWQTVANDFDAALVTLPHTLHGPTGTALVGAGKHVFMEVPLAMKGDEYRAMITAANSSSVILSVGLYRRYLQIARWTRALLQSGILGEVKHFDVREGTVFSSYTSSDVVLQPNVAGGGVLTDTGAHTLDLLLWWLGDVDTVNYYDDGEGGFEADCTLECRLKSGASGQIELSRTRQLRNSIRIEGTEGFVEVHPYKNEVLSGSPNALVFRHEGIGPQDMKPKFIGELFEAGLRDFKATISGTDRIGVSANDGIKSVELIERCYAARQSLLHPWAQARSGTANAEMIVPKLPRGSRVLVTGASGFIGGRLIERLIEEGDVKIRAVVRNAGRAARVARLPVEVVNIDLGNAGEIERAVGGIDYVFHCAFDYDAQASRQNVDGLRNLIDACAAHSVRRMVQLSTCAVYEPFPDGPLTEETPDGDRSGVYVNTKIDLEKMIIEAAHNRGVAATIIQPAIVYGPFSRAWTNVPAEMLIYGDVILPDHGEGFCNAVYIDDLVDSLILAAVSPAAVGERFIIAGPQPVTWADFFSEIARAIGTKPPKFWPREQIAQANHGPTIRLAVVDPRHLIRRAMRWTPLRRALQAGLDAAPAPLRKLMMNSYFGTGTHRTGQTFLPNQQLLALYSAKAIARSEKARARLGYRPQFDFQRGMALTARYLAWAYKDLQEIIATKR